MKKNSPTNLSMVVFFGSLMFQNLMFPTNMTLSQTWTASDTLTLSTTAGFSTESITGFGLEAVQVTSLTLIFSHRGYTQTANIVPASEPWPEGTILAYYQDGVFTSLGSVDLGGNNRVSVSPPSNWLGEGISLGMYGGHQVLYDFPCCSGFTRYFLDAYVEPIPELPDIVLIGVPDDAVVECNAVPEPAVVTATSDCDLPPEVTFDETYSIDLECGTGTITRTWTATDICSGDSVSETQVLTVVDNTPPVLVGVPADATVICNAVPYPESVTATDNCDQDPDVSLEEIPDINDDCGTGTITRIWTATDCSGNSVSEIQVLTVVEPGPCQPCIEIAQAELIQPLAQDRFILAYSMPTPLAKGTIITENKPWSPGEPKRTLRVPRESCFFFIDLVPTHKYDHPVIYALVDVETGELSVAEAYSPPVINGVSYYSNFDERLTSVDRIEPATDDELLKPVVPILLPPPSWPPGPPAITSSTSTIDFAFQNSSSLVRTQQQQVGQKIAIVVASGADSFIKNDAEDMFDLFRYYGFDEVYHFDSANLSLSNLENSILAVDSANNLGPNDLLVLYMSSHSELNGKISYALDQPNKATWPVWNQRGKSKNSVQQVLTQIQAGEVHFILDACYSENLIRLLDFPLREGSRFIPLVPKLGQKVRLFTSALRNEATIGGASVYNSDSYFSWYTRRHTSIYTRALRESFYSLWLDLNQDGFVSREEYIWGASTAHFIASAKVIVESGDKIHPPPERIISNP